MASDNSKEEGSRKSVSGCMLLLTLLYLDSLDTANLVDQDEHVRASAWTDTLVKDVVAMDKMSNNKFEKLPLKAEYRSNILLMLLNPQMIENFVNANMTADSIALRGFEADHS